MSSDVWYMIWGIVLFPVIAMLTTSISTILQGNMPIIDREMKKMGFIYFSYIIFMGYLYFFRAEHIDVPVIALFTTPAFLISILLSYVIISDLISTVFRK